MDYILKGELNKDFHDWKQWSLNLFQAKQSDSLTDINCELSTTDSADSSLQSTPGITGHLINENSKSFTNDSMTSSSDSDHHSPKPNIWNHRNSTFNYDDTSSSNQSTESDSSEGLTESILPEIYGDHSSDSELLNLDPFDCSHIEPSDYISFENEEEFSFAEIVSQEISSTKQQNCEKVDEIFSEEYHQSEKERMNKLRERIKSVEEQIESTKQRIDSHDKKVSDLEQTLSIEYEDSSSSSEDSEGSSENDKSSASNRDSLSDFDSSRSTDSDQSVFPSLFEDDDFTNLVGGRNDKFYTCRRNLKDEYLRRDNEILLLANESPLQPNKGTHRDGEAFQKSNTNREITEDDGCFNCESMKEELTKVVSMNGLKMKIQLKK